MSYGFPLAHAANAFAMTVLMIVLGLCRRSELAVEIGLVHAATLITFQAFSGDARSLILRLEGRISADALLRLRLLLALPLAAAAWFLSAGISLASPGLAAALIARRIGEWIAELHLADAEFRGDRRIAPRFIALQAALLGLSATVLLTQGGALGMAGLCLWALSPLLTSGAFAVRALLRFPSETLRWTFLSRTLPHFSSTLMIAVTVYGFRTIVTALAGKVAGADLITAYSLGGLLSSVFAISAGPSLMFQELSAGGSAKASRFLSPRMLTAVAAYFVAGLALAQWPDLSNAVAHLTGATPLFVRATGASLCGGAAMFLAMRMRYRILQSDDGDSLGPDVLANLVILMLIPLMHSAWGKEGLIGSYLANGLVCLAFVSAAAWQSQLRAAFPRLVSGIRTVLVAGLFLPVFFQLSGGIFQDADPQFDAHGRLSDTPFPFSIAFCYLGLLLVQDFRRAREGLVAVFLTSALVLVATFVSCRGNEELIGPKMLLGLQFLLPMPAFILGQDWGRQPNALDRLARIGFAVTAAILPLQFLGSWNAGLFRVVPSTPLFSIYQAVQYVPIVILGLYLIALFGLFDRARWRTALLVLAPAAAIYAAAALSLLALAFLLFGTWIFLIDRLRRGTERLPATVLTVMSTGAAVMFIGMARPNDESVDIKYAFVQGGVKVPENLIERVPGWRHYAASLLETPQAWLVGHPAPPSRSQFRSAHNFALDFAYNLGLPSLLPLAGLVLATVWQIIRQRRKILADPTLIALTLVVVIAVFLDNQLKVGLRQPYPGIAGYFFCGVLAAQLARRPMPHPDFPRELSDQFGREAELATVGAAELPLRTAGDASRRYAAAGVAAGTLAESRPGERRVAPIGMENRL